MRHDQLRLAIDCGSVNTLALLAWEGGWLPLQRDGSPWLSSAVHVSSGGQILAGQQAWQAAASAPDGFEPAPLRRAGQDRLDLAGVEISAVDLVAATLRSVADEAVRVVGGPVEDVRLVVPAAWGPRRLTWLRQAARHAGLSEVTLVPAPVAVAQHLAASGVPFAVGAYLAVCDLGGGVEASVLRRTPAGFELLSTLDDPEMGGARVDELLVAQLDGHLTGSAGGDGGGRWQSVMALRAAKEAASVYPTVTVGIPPVVLTSGQIEAVARPVLEVAARLTVEAVAAAELTPDRLAGVFVAGGGASMPLAARVIEEAVGREPTVVVEPGAAAVRGAGQVYGPAGTGVEPAVLPEEKPPGPWRAVPVGVPGFASLLLLAAFVAVKERAEGPYNWYRIYERRQYGAGFTVIVNWGELAMASTFILIACLCAATLIASILPFVTSPDAPQRSGGGQMGSALLVAVAVGTSVAGVYALGCALLFEAPIEPFLRWALLPLAPLVIVVVTVALLAARWGRRPGQGWNGFLRFPIGSVIPAAIGMLIVDYMVSHNSIDPLLSGPLTRVGGLLVGVGVALALVRQPLFRLVLAFPLSVVTAGITGISTTGVLAVIYVIAVTVWWLQRLWQLWQRPPQRWLPGR